MSTVLFYRHFKRFYGGHLKVFHYFEHVRSSPLHEARIRFSADSVWDSSNPWLDMPESVVADGEVSPDVLFLAGLDWHRFLSSRQRASSPIPIINLIQGARHARHTDGLLGNRAIRICYSPGIQEMLESAGVNGPVFYIPIGLDLERLPEPVAMEDRDIDCVVLAIKDVRLGRAVAERIRAAGHRVLLVDQLLPRTELMRAMAHARVAVHIPMREEGAYIPALESMALGCLVVCPDCVGNRSFCIDGDTCLVPRRRTRAIATAALQALSASPEELAPMLASAREQSASRSLGAERARFLEILGRVDELWDEG